MERQLVKVHKEEVAPVFEENNDSREPTNKIEEERCGAIDKARLPLRLRIDGHRFSSRAIPGKKIGLRFLRGRSDKKLRVCFPRKLGQRGLIRTPRPLSLVRAWAASGDWG